MNALHTKVAKHPGERALCWEGEAPSEPLTKLARREARPPGVDRWEGEARSQPREKPARREARPPGFAAREGEGPSEPAVVPTRRSGACP